MMRRTDVLAYNLCFHSDGKKPPRVKQPLGNNEKYSMSQGLTESEKFVASISERAFLRLWTHPNPVGKKGKELCDCLIVCGNHIIIISVKYIQYKDTGDIAGWKRWTKP